MLYYVIHWYLSKHFSDHRYYFCVELFKRKKSFFVIEIFLGIFKSFNNNKIDFEHLSFISFLAIKIPIVLLNIGISVWHKIFDPLDVHNGIYQLNGIKSFESNMNCSNNTSISCIATLCFTWRNNNLAVFRMINF